MHAHGLVFAEVKVDPHLGQIRVTRLVGAFATPRWHGGEVARWRVIVACWYLGVSGIYSKLNGAHDSLYQKSCFSGIKALNFDPDDARRPYCLERGMYRAL